MTTRRPVLLPLNPPTPEWVTFTDALGDLEQRGGVIPCRGSTAWTDDEPEARAAAALACRVCPLVDPCAAAAESSGEDWGTWGGRDRSPRHARRAAAS